MLYKQSDYNMLIKKTKQGALVFNSNSGCLAEFTPEEYSNLTNETFERSAIMEGLISQGFVVPKNTNEYNQIVFNETRLLNGSMEDGWLVFVIAPTLLCNMNCYYCFEKGNNNGKKMDLETENNVILFIENRIKSSKNIKNLKISWFGGEPMLCFDNIKRMSAKLIEICKKYNIQYTASMVSNGLLITVDKAQELVNNKITNVQITLDGSQTNYCYAKGVNEQTYKKVIKNIEEISNIIQVSVRLNCTGNNLDELIQLTKNLSKTSKATFYLAQVKNYTNDATTNKTLHFTDCDYINCNNKFLNCCKCNNAFSGIKIEPTPKGTSCSLIRANNAVIGPEGELYMCEHDLGNKEKVVGDIFSGLYYNKHFMDNLQVKHPKKCQKCKIFPLCLSGCKSELMQFGISTAHCKGEKAEVIRKLIAQLKDNKT